MDKLFAISEDFNRRFPNGNEPFQMMTRLLEEGGELAQVVNHFEGAGAKREKYGEPDRAHLAKEIMDVLRCAIQVTIYYGVEKELEMTIEQTYQGMVDEGWIRTPHQKVIH